LLSARRWEAVQDMDRLSGLLATTRVGPYVEQMKRGPGCARAQPAEEAGS
jgi:hypothetical protein